MLPIKIPNKEKRFSTPNNSDLFGNIWHTKNINFDEEGYIKLSPRAVQIKSEDDDNNFGLPISFGREISTNAEFKIVTNDQAYTSVMGDSGLSVTEDTETGNPTFTLDSWGKWFQNRWHATTATALKYRTSGAWTDTGVSLTSGVVHVLEVFRNKLSLAVSNGNTVKLLDITYATTVTLTLPTDYEIIGMSYSNQQMGIITKLADGAVGQNQEAYFFKWDGAGTSAGPGTAMGTDLVVSISPYKSSWVVLTRTGELKYFNGGGWDTIADLPFYFTDRLWGDPVNREAIGDIMKVDGEIILININGKVEDYGFKNEEVMENQPGGIWCYDPEVGLYHRYSPSISPANLLTVPEANVNTTTDIMTASAGTLYSTGNPVKYIGDKADLVGGLKVGKVYYIIKHTSTQFSLAATKDDATAGTKIDLTSDGGTNNYFMALNLLDYGARHLERTGGVELIGDANHTATHIIFGQECYDYDSLSLFSNLNIIVSEFKNIGYVVIPKISSGEIKDNTIKAYIKYRPLKSTDKIILKTKNTDVMGIPVTTPQASLSCTWTDNDTFTTTADLSEVKTYLDLNTNNECEVEIISGAGAGQMAQISSISEAAGTYTVNLAEEIEGATADYRCDVLINNWKKIGEITSTDNDGGFKEFPIAEASKWTKAKVELRGTDVTIEELLVVNATQIPAV